MGVRVSPPAPTMENAQTFEENVMIAVRNIMESIRHMDTTCPNCKIKPKSIKDGVRTVVYSPETQAMHDSYAWDCECGQTYQTLSAPLPHLQDMADMYKN